MSAPIAVSPSGKLLYTGHILDLDTFNGPVVVTGSTFSNIGVKYTSCAVATAMATAPVAASDKYPSYGTKTNYQIKALITVVNHLSTVDIAGNTFSDNTGTKGIIYLDMKHVANSRRVIIAGNTFLRNAGYLESNVIFIRARGPV